MSLTRSITLSPTTRACYCDKNGPYGFRDYEAILATKGGQRPWWLTAQLPVASWRPESQAQVEFEERLAKLAIDDWLLAAPTADQPPASTRHQLVTIANRQSLTVRKWTVETVRRRANVQGYVITGLIDTPIATSGILDDYGQPKWRPADFLPFNSDAILSLEVDRRRQWRNGGDRPDPLSAHCWWAGETVRLSVVLCASQPATMRGELRWRLFSVAADSTRKPMQSIDGSQRVNVQAGQPGLAGVIEMTMPAVKQATAMVLEVTLDCDQQQITNRWPLWCYPKATAWAAPTFLYDPIGQLNDLVGHLHDEPIALPLIGSLPQLPTGAKLITSVVDSALLDFVQSGGCALLLQPGMGALQVRRAPFWRESIKVLCAHSLWQHFPHEGFVDLQFWGLASDASIETDALLALPGVRALTPILRRMDARSLTTSEHLCEVSIGDGRLRACTLRLNGGLGAQPVDVRRNVAGYQLLWAFVAG